MSEQKDPRVCFVLTIIASGNHKDVAALQGEVVDAIHERQYKSGHMNLTTQLNVTEVILP